MRIMTRKRVGIDDQHYQYRELYKLAFRMTNTSTNYSHPNSTAEIFTNISELYDKDLAKSMGIPEEMDKITDSKNGTIGQPMPYWEVFLQTPKSSSDNQNSNDENGESDGGNGLNNFNYSLIIDSNGRVGKNYTNQDEFVKNHTLKITKPIKTKDVNGKMKYTFVIPKMEPKETIVIKLRMMITKEDIGNPIPSMWTATHDLIINSDKQGGLTLPIMERDYGSGYLTENTATDEARNYLLIPDKKEPDRLVTLTALDVESQPLNFSKETNDPIQGEAGVAFLDSVQDDKTFKSYKVVYNNLVNRLTVYPNYKGYVSFWINDKKQWKDEKTLSVENVNVSESLNSYKQSETDLNKNWR